MCGILAILYSKLSKRDLLKELQERIRYIRHRGPDWSGISIIEDPFSGTLHGFAHERLAIVDPYGQSQPIINETKDRKIVLCVNGEIFNNQEIRNFTKSVHQYQSASDCEAVIGAYKWWCEMDLESPTDTDSITFIAQKLSGQYAFILLDLDYTKKSCKIVIARDPMGINPLYTQKDGSTIIVASEMKCMGYTPFVKNTDIFDSVKIFKPGRIATVLYDSELGTVRLQKYQHYTIPRYVPPIQKSRENVNDEHQKELVMLRDTLETTVKDQLMCDVPFGVLLSGGLDSSLITSLVCKNATTRVESQGQEPAHWPRVHSFSIGLVGSPDLKYAKDVATFLGTVHHEFHFTIEEGINAIEDVIWHVETYDITTIRASVPMYLLARRIKAMGIKMVLSGEGADEIFGGYLYFHKAPNANAMEDELFDKLSLLHYYDLQRANKSMMAWGVEVRVPFLDKKFLEVAMGKIASETKMVDPKRRPIEKYILREAFSKPSTEQTYLPDSVLWRQKEQFSDGVGYEWIDALKKHAALLYPNNEFQKQSALYETYNKPLSPEALWYRNIFTMLFGFIKDSEKTLPENLQKTVACSTPRAVQWMMSKSAEDPSGRAVKDVHTSKF